MKYKYLKNTEIKGFQNRGQERRGKQTNIKIIRTEEESVLNNVTHGLVPLICHIGKL